MRLATGHRNRIVVENFVGDVDARSDAGANRQQARVVISPVTEIRKNVLLVGERRLTNPRHALAAHLCERARAIHPHGHIVTADARDGA